MLESTHDWHDSNADVWPWLTYFVRTLSAAYPLFIRRAAADRQPGSKQARVKEYVLRHAPAVFRFADVREALPGISDQTIRMVLEQLRDDGKIWADGVGRAAVWARAE